jgi:hypothetical protein
MGEEEGAGTGGNGCGSGGMSMPKAGTGRNACGIGGRRTGLGVGWVGNRVAAKKSGHGMPCPYRGRAGMDVVLEVGGRRQWNRGGHGALKGVARKE